MVNQATTVINNIAANVEAMCDHNEKDKLFSYHGLQPMVLRSTKTKIEEGFEPIKEKEYSTGDEVVVNGPGGCFAIAGGLSLLATEFPAAQRILDQGKNKIRQFAEKEEEEGGSDSEFVILDDDEEEKEQEEDGAKNNRRNYAKTAQKSLRNLAKNQILPLLDRMSSEQVQDKISTERV